MANLTLFISKIINIAPPQKMKTIVAIFLFLIEIFTCMALPSSSLPVQVMMSAPKAALIAVLLFIVLYMMT